jgi:hypothetical protein
MLGKIDIVMGSFSKTFASNGGFVSCNFPAVRQYLKFYGCSATFSNALSPVQAATVTKAFEIVRSERGRDLRWLLMKRVSQLRKALAAAGLEVIGNPSAIVPVVVGDEALARMVSRLLPELGVVANLVEYPAVAKGNARFRFQVMPNHTPSPNTSAIESGCRSRRSPVAPPLERSDITRSERCSKGILFRPSIGLFQKSFGAARRSFGGREFLLSAIYSAHSRPSSSSPIFIEPSRIRAYRFG